MYLHHLISSGDDQNRADDVDVGARGPHFLKFETRLRHVAPRFAIVTWGRRCRVCPDGSRPPVETDGDREPQAGDLDFIHGLDRCIDAHTARLHRISAPTQDSSTLRERVSVLANRTRQWLSDGEAVCKMPQKRGPEEQLDSGIVWARPFCYRFLSP